MTLFQQFWEFESGWGGGEGCSEKHLAEAAWDCAIEMVISKLVEGKCCGEVEHRQGVCDCRDFIAEHLRPMKAGVSLAHTETPQPERKGER
jgi:hypothetical protein